MASLADLQIKIDRVMWIDSYTLNKAIQHLLNHKDDPRKVERYRIKIALGKITQWMKEAESAYEGLGADHKPVSQKTAKKLVPKKRVLHKARAKAKRRPRL